MAEKVDTKQYESNMRIPLCIFIKDARSVLKMDELGLEIARIAFPAALAVAADPIASIVDTAFIGHIGFLLLMRVIAVTFCVTLSASMAARQGSTSMAAFQVCLQLWLTTSLLADGLAVAGQAILASAFAKKDYERAAATASRVLQLGLVLGLVLAIILGVGLQYGARLFTNDVHVLHFIGVGIPFVAATQPINALAFVFDGVNFGASDFSYSAFSMVVVAVISILLLLLFSPSLGFVGLWITLTIYMSLRAFAGVWRIGTGTGPWKFLRS